MSNNKDRSNIFITIGIFLIVAGIFYIVISNFESTTNGSNVLANVIQDPLLYGILGLIITFLVVRQWSNLEDNVRQIGKDQLDAIREIREDADKITKQRVEAVSIRAQEIKSRVDNLLEEHPWLSYITDNEFIPNASSCRIVLRTAETLVEQGKEALAYEYLFGWANPRNRRWTKESEDPLKGVRLEGTVEDFVDLAFFCERMLGDEYLGLLILEQGYGKALNRSDILPIYLSRLTRYGSPETAYKVALDLRQAIDHNWLYRQWLNLRGIHYFHRQSFLLHGFASLSLYEAANRHQRSSLRYLAKAERYLGEMALKNYLLVVKAEIFVVFGDYSRARELLNKIEMETDGDTEFEVARLRRTLGDSSHWEELLREISDSEDSIPRELATIDSEMKPVQEATTKSDFHQGVEIVVKSEKPVEVQQETQKNEMSQSIQSQESLSESNTRNK